MFVMGLDIGYSNLKLAFGRDSDDQPRTDVMPVGAGPVNLLPQSIRGNGKDNVLHVEIDGEKWVAGVEPERLQGWDRELHSDYPSTDSYRALFYAGLLLSEQDTIDVLVTGLPVDQHQDQNRRKDLAKRLCGSHRITPKRTVEVKEVVVLAQPIGAYMDLVCSTIDEELVELIDEGRTVVIDPGFFSVDWVLFAEGEVRYRSSGTSLKAMSVFLEQMNNLIRDDHGAAPGVDRLEKTIRAKKDSLLLLGVRIDVRPYYEKAMQLVAPAALVPLRQSMREHGMDTDIVLLAGGGAGAYHAAAKDIFNRSRVVQPKDAVLANARGFWHCGRMHNG